LAILYILSCWNNIAGIVEIIKGPKSNHEGFITYEIVWTLGHYVLPSLLVARFLFWVDVFYCIAYIQMAKKAFVNI
jgi:hypothetical protein